MGSHRYLAASGSELWCWQPSSSPSSSHDNKDVVVVYNDDNDNDDNDDDDDNDGNHHSTNSILLSSPSHPTTITTSTSTSTTSGEIVNHTVSTRDPAMCNELTLVRDLHSVIWDVKMNCDQSSIITGSADGILRYVILLE